MSALENEEANFDCVVDFNLEPQEEMQYPPPNMNHGGRMHHSHLLPAPLSMPLMNSHHYLTAGQLGHQMMGVGGVPPVHHPQIPTTPPETPPGSSSSNGSLTPPHFHHHQGGGMPQHVMDDKSWNAAYMMAGAGGNRCTGHEPLDLHLRPNPTYMPEHMHEQSDWFNRKYDHHQRSMSGMDMKSPASLNNMSHSSPGSVLDDDDLLALSVRDLNKKLHNMPKESQQKLKQRRRTLKNRGYAQSCRYKRQSYRQDLEVANKKLLDENHRLQRQIDSLTSQHQNLWKSNEALKKQLEKLTGSLHQQAQSSPRGATSEQPYYGM